ncbi:MAG: hypothetical protein D6826_00795 [Alphaproteobacteria bacterium]|nr:MAG: hypothetical protein D6826_00795 [Alphaproteobacteria bacterium]
MMEHATDFWADSGYPLLRRTERGHLALSDDFLRAYLQRPEMAPVAESCAAERALHAALMRDPRLAVPAARLSELADPDARDNYRIFLHFRDRLIEAGTIEGCYLRTFLPAADAPPATVDIPPLFIDQMARVVVRGILEGCRDGLRARAAELLFRRQKVSLREGAIMLADAETVEMYATTGGFGSLGRLVAEAQTPLRTVELDVLGEANADLYWDRADRHDTVLDLSFAGAGLDALCRVLEAWIHHFLDVTVAIQPVQSIRDEKWVWHIGLDVEGTRLLNDLYNGHDVDEARLARLLALFRLDFAEPSVMPAAIAGRPVYLALCMGEDETLRLKPQNLLVNLPLAERA